MIKKLNEFLPKMGNRLNFIYEKIDYGYFGILSMVSGITTILICSLLFYSVEPFTILSHWVSNLGGITTNSGEFSNFSNVVFSIGLFITALFTTLFVIGLIKDLLSSSSKINSLLSIGFIFSLLCLGGIIGVALFDLKGSPFIHAFTAMFFFLGSSFMVFFYNLAIIFDERWPYGIGIIAIFVPFSALIFSLSFIPHLLQGKGIVALILSRGPEFAFSRVWEWIYIMGLFAWFFFIGIIQLFLNK
jgi:hypothetical protein